MRSRWVFVAAAVLLLSGSLSVIAAPPRNAVLKLARSSNELGFDLYQRLRQKPGNLVISPASLTMALSMAWGGARGETAAQMRKVLHLQGTPDETMAASGELSLALQATTPPIVLRISNQLFGEKTYKLVPAYVQKTQAAFHAPIERLDFKTAPESARAHINQWIESRTEHRIRDLIPPGTITPLTRLVLVNAIYFLGSWETPFEPWETHPEPFYLTPSQKKPVPTMNRNATLWVGRKEGVTAVELPYKGGKLSMLLLVPDRIDGLAAVEKTLDLKRLDALRAAMKAEYLWLSLPKFELSPAPLGLRGDLEALGMTSAFDPKRADLTGIASPPDRDTRLFLQDVFHKGFVKVDEKGTEAAAATADLSPMGSEPPPPPRRLLVNHPFLFLIRDDASGMILFLGRVSDPGGR